MPAYLNMQSIEPLMMSPLTKSYFSFIACIPWSFVEIGVDDIRWQMAMAAAGMSAECNGWFVDVQSPFQSALFSVYAVQRRCYARRKL